MKVSALEMAYHDALEPLTLDEREQFKRAEEIIAKNYSGFLAAASALRDICLYKLYRETDDSWPAYCERRWGISGRHGYRQVEAANTLERVGAAVGHMNEFGARALASFEEEIQKAVYQVALATATKGTNGKPIITAAHIRSVGDQITQWVVSGGMDNGNGVMKPLGVLVRAHVTEDVYERMMRQQSHIREKMEAKSVNLNGNSKLGTQSPQDVSISGGIEKDSGEGLEATPAPIPRKPRINNEDLATLEWVQEPVTIVPRYKPDLVVIIMEALEKYVEAYEELERLTEKPQRHHAEEKTPAFNMLRAIIVKGVGQQFIATGTAEKSSCRGCLRQILTNRGSQTIVDGQTIHTKTWNLCERCMKICLGVIRIVGGVTKDQRQPLWTSSKTRLSGL